MGGRRGCSGLRFRENVPPERQRHPRTVKGAALLRPVLPGPPGPSEPASTHGSLPLGLFGSHTSLPCSEDRALRPAEAMPSTSPPQAVVSTERWPRAWLRAEGPGQRDVLCRESRAFVRGVRRAPCFSASSPSNPFQLEQPFLQQAAFAQFPSPLLTLSHACKSASRTPTTCAPPPRGRPAGSGAKGVSTDRARFRTDGKGWSAPCPGPSLEAARSPAPPALSLPPPASQAPWPPGAQEIALPGGHDC